MGLNRVGHEVADFVKEHLIQELKKKGVPITDGPTQTSSGSTFIFIDAPDGYEIELIQRPDGVAIV